MCQCIMHRLLLYLDRKLSCDSVSTTNISLLPAHKVENVSNECFLDGL